MGDLNIPIIEPSVDYTKVRFWIFLIKDLKSFHKIFILFLDTSNKSEKNHSIYKSFYGPYRRIFE